jgi:hypothetical protein
MNRKIFLVCAAIMVMAMGVAGFAYKRSTGAVVTSAISCCGDSCPTKAKNASSTTDGRACCDCCGGDSCPMKNGEHAKAMAGTDHSKMGDSCPMHNKDAKAQNVSATASADGKTSGNCSCCNHKNDKAAAPAV